eukprot:scaffold64983_cov31-Tisochrysis_lutea.AAC.5
MERHVITALAPVGAKDKAAELGALAVSKNTEPSHRIEYCVAPAQLTRVLKVNSSRCVSAGPSARRKARHSGVVVLRHDPVIRWPKNA